MIHVSVDSATACILDRVPVHNDSESAPRDVCDERVVEFHRLPEPALFAHRQCARVGVHFPRPRHPPDDRSVLRCMELDREFPVEYRAVRERPRQHHGLDVLFRAQPVALTPGGAAKSAHTSPTPVVSSMSSDVAAVKATLKLGEKSVVATSVDRSTFRGSRSSKPPHRYAVPGASEPAAGYASSVKPHPNTVVMVAMAAATSDVGDGAEVTAQPLSASASATAVRARLES